MKKKYYDDEDDGFAEIDHPQRMFLSNERLTLLDWILAAVLGVLAFLGVTVFALPGLVPSLWDGAAVAAGLRPPVDIFPGFWRTLAGGLFLGGVSSGVAMLRLLGHLCLGCMAGATYLFLRTVIALLVRGRLRFAVRRYLIQRVAAVIGAILFVCADPVWLSAQAFSSEELMILLTILGLTPFVVFMLNGTLGCAYVSMCLLGLLAAETPLGIMFVTFCWIAYHMALRHDALSENTPLLDPLTAQTAKWILTFFWGFGFILGVVLNCWSFLRMGGGAVLTSSLPIAYAQRWLSVLMEAMGGLGWIFAFALCALPFLVSSITLPRAVDEERFLPYHVGGIFFISGVIAYSQLSMAHQVWFWTWSPLTEVRLPYMLQVFLLLAAITVSYFLVVLGTDACCRNHVRLASFRVQDETGAEPTRASIRRARIVLFGVVALVLLAGVLPGRRLVKAHRMLGIVDDYMAELLKECGDAAYVFTDGVFDARLELAAAEKGRQLPTLSLRGGDSAYEKKLSMRVATDEEDRTALGMGVATLLRTWKRDKPERLEKAAFMMGHSQWLRDGETVPPSSGTVMRLGMPEAELKDGVAAAHKLATRILDLYAAGGPDASAGAVAKKVFLLIQWRLARFARLRAVQADLAGDLAQAKTEQKFADRLDDANGDLKGLIKLAERRRAATLRQVTPREGLQLALLRADFALASRYAKPILEADPDDPDANFGEGMNYFELEQWTRAKDSLMRCLTRKPSEPAVLNNLALALLKLGSFDEAEAYGLKAQKLLPESDEVKDTLAQIAAARKTASAGAKEPAKDGGKASATPPGAAR